MVWVCSGQPGSRVKSFAVSSNGKVGVTVLFDSTISVWDLKTMQVRLMVPKLAWSFILLSTLLLTGQRQSVPYHGIDF